MKKLSQMESQSPGASMTEGEDLRAKAIRRIKRKRDFLGHIAVFLVINAGLWVVWAVDDADTDDLWPAWVTGIWLVILVLDAFKVYGERPISDQQIDKEMRRIKGG
jgi:2TM domain